MIEWIAGLVEETGYLGILLLMFAENVFPPIPSELVMPLAGFAAAQGTLSLAGVILAGSAGALLGALFWYGIGRWVGCERLRRFAGRHGAWLTIAPGDVDRAQSWFRRHGWAAVFVGRIIPGIRTLISVPAGIAEMPLGIFLAFSALGTAAWTTLLAVAGYLLEERYEAVAHWLNPAANVVIGGLVLAYLLRLLRSFRTRQAG
jgi:membrane protein DedA with SNARE-associated domain